MLKILGKKLLLVLYFVLGALIIEAVTFLGLKFGFMPSYFFYNLTIILAIAFLIYAIPNFIAQYVIYTIILLLQAVMALVNHCVYSGPQHNLFTLDMLNLLDEAAAVVNVSYIDFGFMFQLISFFMIIAITGYIALRYVRKTKISVKEHYSLLAAIMLIAAEVISCGQFFIIRGYINRISPSDPNYYYSDAYALNNSSMIQEKSLKRFGSYGYFVNLLIGSRLQKGNKKSEENQLAINYFNSGKIYGQDEISSVFGIDEGNNVVVVMMESIEWFGFGNGTYNNDILSPELTPNVYQLVTNNTVDTVDDSIRAMNFFARSKTNISEGQGNIGNYPKGKSLTTYAGGSYNKESNGFGYTLPSMLKSLGYTTSYVHSNRISFYGRSKTHGNIGFENVIGKENVVNDRTGKLDYDISWEHWEEEGRFARNAMEFIIPDNYATKPFYTFYLNVSSHGHYLTEHDEYDLDAKKYHDYIIYGENCEQDENGYYHISSDKMGDPTYYTEFYSNIVSNYADIYPTDANEFYEEVVSYMCGVKGLDDAIGEIVSEMKSKVYPEGHEFAGDTIYDHTTMLLYSDHLAYSEKLSNHMKSVGVENEDDYDFDLNTIPMIISSPGVKAKNATLPSSERYIVNDRFCSAYDVIPTLFDLLGVKFNENLYVGNSLFKALENQYTVNGEPVDVVAYVPSIEGFYCRDIYSKDLVDFTYRDPEHRVLSNDALDLFKAELSKVITKINYLDILNKNKLYSSLDPVEQ